MAFSVLSLLTSIWQSFMTMLSHYLHVGTYLHRQCLWDNEALHRNQKRDTWGLPGRHSPVIQMRWATEDPGVSLIMTQPESYCSLARWWKFKLQRKISRASVQSSIYWYVILRHLKDWTCEYQIYSTNIHCTHSKPRRTCIYKIFIARGFFRKVMCKERAKALIKRNKITVGWWKILL